MKTISSTNYEIHFNGEAYDFLNNHIKSNGLKEVFVLVDMHTFDFCFNQLKQQLSDEVHLNIIKIPAGESNKNITTCLYVWNQLTDFQVDRNSLMINLGGGMVTDLGGFVASTYKRGINFINIPTTLLSMVDASVGSKTGVDLNNLKNLIGLFSDPEMVIIDLNYLETLPTRELNSGLAEIVKYGLTFDEDLLNKIFSNTWKNKEDLADIVHKSITIKNKVVREDFKELGLRKVLNFGHTIGHAIESFYLNSPDLEDLLHGEAIGIGMVIEGHISHIKHGFPLDVLSALKANMVETYGKINIASENYPAIMDLCKYDKKNTAGKINYVLLKSIGEFVLNQEVNDQLVVDGFNFYLA